MEINKRTKLLLVTISAFLVMIISTVSYAYFSATVAGNTTAKTSVIETGNMEVTYNEGSVVGTTTNILPGQYVQKIFTVENTGTVDTTYSIYLNNVENNFVTKSDLVYELITTDGRVVNQTTCPDSNTAIATNIALPVGTTHHYTIRITFKETNLNQNDNKGKSFTAKIGLIEESNPTAYTIVSGDLDTVESIVKIADEEFYVIGQEDENHVKLLPKWNLKVGGIYNNIGYKIGEYTSSDTGYGLQSSQMRGRTNEGTDYYGIVHFSNDTYWYEREGDIFNPKFGDSWPVWVYTNEKENGEYIASVAEYVDNYVEYLNTQGVNVTGRLINLEEVIGLGCDDAHYSEDPSTLLNSPSYSCDIEHGGTAPEWVYQTTYWTGTATDYDGYSSYVEIVNYSVYRDGTVEGAMSYANIESEFAGVRPVIILEK